jgi:hypothetical protein
MTKTGCARNDENGCARNTGMYFSGNGAVVLISLELSARIPIWNKVLANTKKSDIINDDLYKTK